jgi:AcrR family transcriptional regulator
MQKPTATSAAPAADRRLTRAEAKANTRRRVLETAGVVFRREGYHGASLDQVAREAGFTKGAVYSTFESKADLFFALLDERAAQRRAEIERVMARASEAEEGVAEVARRFARSVAADREWWSAVLEFMIVAGRDQDLRARYSQHHDATRAALAETIAAWQRRSGGRLELDPRRVGTAVLALNNGLTLEGLLASAEVPTRLYVDAQLALLRGVLSTDAKEAER